MLKNLSTNYSPLCTMDTDPISKIISLFKLRGLDKEANILETIFSDLPTKPQLISECPICGDMPEEDCVLCDGSGELFSTTPDDDEDQRILEELSIK